MRQLSGLDAVFFYRETPGAPMHVGTLMIYDGSTAPGGEVTFDSIKENIARRLHLAQIFRQRILPVPLGADHPYWTDDARFDLEHHVRRVVLPRPGNLQQLWAEAAELLARPLDLSRPPWEIVVIEGLDGVTGTTGGSFAVVDKVHHAAIDGLSGMEVIAAIHDRHPTPCPTAGAAVGARVGAVPVGALGPGRPQQLGSPGAPGPRDGTHDARPGSQPEPPVARRADPTSRPAARAPASTVR